jgi:hypothetical protein
MIFGVYSIISRVTGCFSCFLGCSRYCPAQGSQVSPFVSPLSIRFEVAFSSEILIIVLLSTELLKVLVETIPVSLSIPWPSILSRSVCY